MRQEFKDNVFNWPADGLCPLALEEFTVFMVTEMKGGDNYACQRTPPRSLCQSLADKRASVPPTSGRKRGFPFLNLPLQGRGATCADTADQMAAFSWIWVSHEDGSSYKGQDSCG